MNRTNITNAGLSGLIAQKIVGSVANSLTAAGNSSATAAVCPGDINIFTTVTSSNNGCKVGIIAVGNAYSLLAPGDEVVVANYNSVDALLVYPPTGGAWNNGTVDAAYSVAAGTSIHIRMISNINGLVK